MFLSNGVNIKFVDWHHMLKERQKSILDAVIQEYIDTARPVASRELSRRFRFGVSPATIRNEMLELDELGYLEQPHTSAGRIPTDKGFRFYVDEFVVIRKLSIQRFNMQISEEDEFFHESAKIMAEASHSFAVFGMPRRHNFEKSGFSEIMQEPEFADSDFARDFGKLADEFENMFDNFFHDLIPAGEPRAFIGGENPVRSARRCGMVISRMPTADDEDGFLALIGPKRMDYRRNINLINEIRDYARRFTRK